ncbi:MAG: TIGR03560 family F420-dependent LLM class oxidoreductase [Actinomycetota bacterium]|nr:TIGR03560 family F420-dependent LLM class oxidoreductase [Actinomycetota bacterium]MDH5224855.1 TIGR03560 family F420-dependent LLM class oxidoreductase [Actinomycetota bacterium]MDH5313623.1 TIGR03560 family F420-dependent LLM class oxidoreductase [Actinomycetota bacterium]
MRFCLMLEGQEGVTWPDWLGAARAAERLGFEAIFTSDHYLSVMRHRARDRGSSDAWTMLSALAASTETIRLGTMVSPVTFRLPAVLAKAAVTVDRVSDGRVEIGMGAGWWEEEHRTHGFGFPEVATRFDMLAEQLEIVHGLLTDDRFSFHGKHYQLEDVAFAPKGIQHPHPPIVVGGNGGPRVAELVSRWADEFNTVGPSPDQARERFGGVRDRLDADGRSQDTLTTSVMTWCYVGETEADAMRVIEAARRRAMRVARFEDELDELRAHCVVGSADQAVERLNQYAEAGVQRIMLNHELFDDLEMLDVLAERVFPHVDGAS